MNRFFLLAQYVLFFLSFPSNVHGSYHFQPFELNDKLPSNSVVRMYNDAEGYMWFGTKDGLCRFDGYQIKIFRSSALTPGKLPNNEIQCITGDGKHKIWVGTLEGIVIVDKQTFAVSTFDHPLVARERINSILIDKEGFVWIGTSGNGVLRHNPETGKTEQYSSQPHSKIKIPDNNVNHIFQDSKGRIWISMWRNGLLYIEPDSNEAKRVAQIGKGNNPFRFFEDNEGEFWVCTWGDGMFKLNETSGGFSISPLRFSSQSKVGIPEIAYSITQDDNDGRIWIVTFNGLSVLTKQTDGSVTVENGRLLFDQSSSGLFHEIIKDRRGNLWVGSIGDGLYRLDFNRLPVQNYSFDSMRDKLNVPAYITRITETSDRDMFVVVNRVGVFWFNPETGESERIQQPVLRALNSVSNIRYIQHKSEFWITQEGEDIIYVARKKGNDLELIDYFSLNNDRTASENNISYIYEDSKRNIWIGTGMGLYVKRFRGQIEKLGQMSYSITALKEDKAGNLWIGAAKGGVFRTSLATHGDFRFENIPLTIENYSSYSAQSINVTPQGEVYIGTREGCLYLYKEDDNKAIEISGLYGITEEGIMDIQVDSEGVLWISTIKRIVRYNPENHASTYFSTADGLQVSLFHKDAVAKLKSGQLLFGGNGGIVAFDPLMQVMAGNGKKQKVYITDVLVQNKSLFDRDAKLNFNPLKNRITLNNSQNNISIEFSALNYLNAAKIQYAYKLSGIDNDWNYVDNTRRFVNYSGLPAGTYTFMVRANDENGTWTDEVTTIKIEIEPPLYLTWWAYLIYILLIAVVAVFVLRNLSNRIRLRNELKISKIEKDKSEELAQVKLRYFTNISHELLTPLTIILLQIDSLQQKLSSDVVQFDVMRDNVLRLKRLIQQILVFRKTESGNMKLKIQNDDIVAFVNNICQSSFRPLVSEKHIHFSVSFEKESCWAHFDPDKLDKAVYNVLSNAFKYTPENGEISVKMSFTERHEITYMRLSVSDSGKGIAEEDLPHIFKRFYISKSADQSQSHGIGLALTSDLLQLHKGNISVKSEINEGSVFTIEIPVSANAYSDEELSGDEVSQKELNAIPMLSGEITGDEIPEDQNEVDNEIQKDFSILIAEDNKELNKLITDSFSDKYHVLSAEDGVKALEIIRTNEVDLVISDVMMPDMDGLTLCKLVKNDVATSHIHVLMLTAKNTTEDRIDCYNAGADAYIAKPFELKVLRARVKNLITKRVQKTESFKSNQEINISSMEYSSIDEVFLKQAVKVVEDKISDDSFDFDQFAMDMATSKSTLHRKLKSLTGLSPGEFIRNVRLKHAVQMLHSNVGNISEIAFAVGFNDPKYFSRCFKIEFGMTPKEFQEAHRLK
ncbi:MAG: response regulator [Paludibacteraceae bacterium]|nr:response regulator [Paludibacteraceae bacterium]